MVVDGKLSMTNQAHIYRIKRQIVNKMKYVKVFDTHSDYNTYINGQNSLLPNVSYCEDMNEVHFNPYVPIETRLIGTVVGKATGTRRILYSSSLFSEIEIDGVVQPSVVRDYEFGDTNEHTIKYTLVDPTTIGTNAFQSSYIRELIIPSTVTTIGINAFGGSSLEEIIIPDSVTSIGNSAFSVCLKLENIIIGSGVTSIDYDAFYMAASNVQNDLTITVKATTPPTLGNRALDFDNNGDTYIYVPAESVAAYKAASGWSTYASAIEAIPST